MKKAGTILLLFASIIYADDVQIEAGCRTLVSELEMAREKNENISTHQEAFIAFVDLIRSCEQEKPTFREVGKKKLQELGLLDQNGIIKPTVCQVMTRMAAQIGEKENK